LKETSMLRGPAILALLLVVLSPASSLAQLTPPAGSAGAGNSAISGIPAGPANNPTVYDPSGSGNAARTPSPPSQATIPVTPASPGFGNTVLAPRSGARPARVRVLRQAEIRAPRSARSSKARAAVTARDRKIDGKFSICRGC
jgi:hypothetical protein